jgi:large subunit ribosomal protein L4
MSAQAKQVNQQGQAQGEKALNESVFALSPNMSVLHEAVLRELSNARSGSANSKTRGEVRGGGRKPWKQKGTGRARVGSIRSPLWRGGGVIFGPKPRSFEKDMPKKVRRLAAVSALSLASAEAKLVFVDQFAFLNQPKTKQAEAFFKSVGIAGQKILVLADWRLEENAALKLSVRNLPYVQLSLPDAFSVKDVVEADAVVLTQDALNSLEKRLAL